MTGKRLVMLRIAFDQMNLIKGDTLYRGLGQVLGWGNIRSLFPLIRPKQFVLHKAVPMCGTVYEWPVPQHRFGWGSAARRLAWARCGGPVKFWLFVCNGQLSPKV